MQREDMGEIRRGGIGREGKERANELKEDG